MLIFVEKVTRKSIYYSFTPQRAQDPFDSYLPLNLIIHARYTYQYQFSINIVFWNQFNFFVFFRNKINYHCLPLFQYLIDLIVSKS